MVTVELVQRYDLEYEAVCVVARRIYEEVLGIQPTSLPPIFLALFDNGVPVGSVALQRGDEVDRLLTEKHCAGQGIDPKTVFPRHESIPRWQIAEPYCLNLERPYRRDFTPVLFSQVYEYAYATGCKFLFLTQAVTLKRSFRYLNTELIFLCEPDLNTSEYETTPEERKQWNEVYFSKLKPTCCLIDVEQAFYSYRKRREENEHLLPGFEVGERIADVLKTKLLTLVK